VQRRGHSLNIRAVVACLFWEEETEVWISLGQWRPRRSLLVLVRVSIVSVLVLGSKRSSLVSGRVVPGFEDSLPFEAGEGTSGLCGSCTAVSVDIAASGVEKQTAGRSVRGFYDYLVESTF